MNNTEKVKILNEVLSKVQGFDYVKENERSRKFISVARNLQDIHFTMNNFYNEINAIKELESLGTKFPRPALKACITSILYVKLGNSYGRSWDAQDTADQLLNRLTKEEWLIYLNNYVKEEESLIN
ncbi:MAG: hypothetical protein J1E96_03115 [Ruminococcus sp.]|nr:hypothetical protein [Ruminococcus sp.]